MGALIWAVAKFIYFVRPTKKNAANLKVREVNLYSEGQYHRLLLNSNTIWNYTADLIICVSGDRCSIPF